MEWSPIATDIEEMLEEMTGHMRPEIVECTVAIVETDEGNEYFPLDMLDSLNPDDYKDYSFGVPVVVSPEYGFLGRLSTEEQMECTEWLFATNYDDLVEIMYEHFA
jgi:hypothetical protein